MSIQPEFEIPQWTVADRLRKAREHAGLDQSEFAQEIGVSRATVSNNERGMVQPRKIVLKALAMRTGVPLAWLESGVNDERPSPGGESLSDECTPRDLNPEPTDSGSVVFVTFGNESLEAAA